MGSSLRIRILAQDVMLAITRPEGISALNILPATVRDIRQGDGPGALVRLDAGGEVILARITRRSAEALALAPGKPVFAVLKAVSVAQESVGGKAR
jgi:molybdate transport system ATP-binding protein